MLIDDNNNYGVEEDSFSAFAFALAHTGVNGGGRCRVISRFMFVVVSLPYTSRISQKLKEA